MQEGCMLVSVPYHPHAINLFKFSNPVFGIFRIFSELWRRIPDYEGVQYLYILQGAVIAPPSENLFHFLNEMYRMLPFICSLACLIHNY